MVFRAVKARTPSSVSRPSVPVPGLRRSPSKQKRSMHAKFSLNTKMSRSQLLCTIVPSPLTWQSFSYSFNVCLFSTYYIPDTILGARVLRIDEKCSIVINTIKKMKDSEGMD